MPAALTDSGERGFAETHFKFVSQHQADDQFLSVALGALAAGECRRKNVGRMRWILLPVNVVVIHTADHEGVGERGRDGIDTLAGANYRSRTFARDLVEHFDSDLYIVLLVAAEGAADGIQQEALGLIHGILRELLVIQACRPAGHLRGDSFFGCDYFFSGGQDSSLGYVTLLSLSSRGKRGICIQRTRETLDSSLRSE